MSNKIKSCECVGHNHLGAILSGDCYCCCNPNSAMNRSENNDTYVETRSVLACTGVGKPGSMSKVVSAKKQSENNDTYVETRSVLACTGVGKPGSMSKVVSEKKQSEKEVKEVKEVKKVMHDCKCGDHNHWHASIVLNGEDIPCRCCFDYKDDEVKVVVDTRIVVDCNDPKSLSITMAKDGKYIYINKN